MVWFSSSEQSCNDVHGCSSSRRLAGCPVREGSSFSLNRRTSTDDHSHLPIFGPKTRRVETGAGCTVPCRPSPDQALPRQWLLAGWLRRLYVPPALPSTKVSRAVHRHRAPVPSHGASRRCCRTGTTRWPPRLQTSWSPCFTCFCFRQCCLTAGERQVHASSIETSTG